MKVMHIILFHDDHVVCKNKKCKNKVFITPVDLEGMWSCPKCEKLQQIIGGVKISLGTTE